MSRRRQRISAVLRLTVVFLVLPTVGAQASELSELPSVECVRALRAARIAGMSGDIEGERALLRQAVESFPREVAPVYTLLMHHRSHPLPEDEFQRFRAAFSARLNDPQQDLPIGALQRVVVDAAADEEMLLELTQHFRRRLDEKPDDRAQILGSLALLYDRLEDREAAAEVLTELRTLAPTSHMTWALYRTLVELERWDQALVVFDDLLAEDHEGDLRGTHIKLLGKAGRTDEQHRTIEAYLSENDATGVVSHAWLDVLRASAWDLRDAGKDEEAEALFSKVYELGDLGVGRLLLHLYGTDEMRAESRRIERSVLAKEEDPRLLFDLGTDKLASGDATGALELLLRAAPELPDLEAAWYNLGMAAYRAGEWQTADSAFGKASELNGSRADSFFFRGMARNQLEDCQGAVESLETALALDASRTTAHYYLAACYRNLGDVGAAARHTQLYAESRQ